MTLLLVKAVVHGPQSITVMVQSFQLIMQGCRPTSELMNSRKKLANISMFMTVAALWWSIILKPWRHFKSRSQQVPLQVNSNNSSSKQALAWLPNLMKNQNLWNISRESIWISMTKLIYKATLKKKSQASKTNKYNRLVKMSVQPLKQPLSYPKSSRESNRRWSSRILED